MNPRQTVVFSTLLSLLIFWAAGDEAARKTSNGLRALQGKPGVSVSNESGPKLTVTRIAGWGVLFLILIVLTDIEVTQELAIAFAYLILLSMFLGFGPDAFANINKILSLDESASGGSGGGGGINHR